MELFRKGKNCTIAKFHRTDLFICDHSREGKILSYSQINTVPSIYILLQQHGISDPTEIIFEMSKDERKQFYRTVARGLQRPLFSVYRRVIRMYDQKNHIGKYSPEEMVKLRE